MNTSRALGILTTPYKVLEGEVLLAVVPLQNESETSLVELLVISDHLVGAIEETQGLRCLPIDRTLAAMEGLTFQRVRTPAESRTLAQTLDVDGIVVGSVTACDPYAPMVTVAGIEASDRCLRQPASHRLEPQGCRRGETARRVASLRCRRHQSCRRCWKK